MQRNIEKPLPSPRELEADLREYLSRKYGDRVQVQIPEIHTDPETEPHSIDEPPTAEIKPSVERIRFDLNPEELERYLDHFVVEQREAKEILATKICTHYKRVRRILEGQDSDDDIVGNIKNNIILIGPTGVGKTFLIKLIAKKLGVPFVKGDATKFSETGYVGGDVEDLVRDLVHEANGDLDLACFGIIFIDEIDKIASSSQLIGADVSRTGVQRALLKPMEETDVELRVPHDMVSQLQAVAEFQRSGKAEKRAINTRHILFIVSGAFGGLEEIISKRENRKRIGFETGANLESDAEIRRQALLARVRAEDLIAYGFESEFIGRLPIVAVLHQLDENHLFEILKRPNSSVVQSKRLDFRAYGIDLRFEDDALREIARLAAEEHTGARGLVRAMESALLKFEKCLPSTEIRRLLVTRELVERPSETLTELLADPHREALATRFGAQLNRECATLLSALGERQSEFERRFGAPISERRLQIVVARSITTGQDPDAVIEQVRGVHRSLCAFEEQFNDEFDTNVRLSEGAIDRLTELSFELDRPAEVLCRERFRNYQHGYKLLQERQGISKLELPERAVDDPDAYLNECIQQMYRQH
ncbi:MAG: AAA family ATPase [Myxococcales bacterium]|nr:AAA family ATPase [Myxococcales bacterium]